VGSEDHIEGAEGHTGGIGLKRGQRRRVGRRKETKKGNVERAECRRGGSGPLRRTHGH
jgi:hypothetical protein